MEYINWNYKDTDIENLDINLFEHKGDNIASSEQIYTKPYSYWNTVFKKIAKNPVFVACVIILIIFLIMSFSIAVGKPVLVGQPSKNILRPSSEHWFGTGVNGEDLWNEMWIASRTTLMFAVAVFLIQATLGILIGSIWGFYKKVDVLFLEIVRLLTTIPSLILWLVIIFIFDNRNLGIIVFAISITSWIGLASMIRIQIIITRNAEYNIASKVLGSKGPKIIRKNIMPKILPIIIQTCAFAIPEAIAIDSTLAYLGFGFIQPSDIQKASLGSVLNGVLSGTDWQINMHLLIIPLGFIGGLSLIFYLIAKVLSDSLDPKTHR